MHPPQRQKEGRWYVKLFMRQYTSQCLSSVKGLYVTVTDLASHSVRLFDVKVGAVVHRFECPKEMSRPPWAALSPDGQFLAWKR